MTEANQQPKAMVPQEFLDHFTSRLSTEVGQILVERAGIETQLLLTGRDLQLAQARVVELQEELKAAQDEIVVLTDKLDSRAEAVDKPT